MLCLSGVVTVVSGIVPVLYFYILRYQDYRHHDDRGHHDDYGYDDVHG